MRLLRVRIGRRAAGGARAEDRDRRVHGSDLHHGIQPVPGLLRGRGGVRGRVRICTTASSLYPACLGVGVGLEFGFGFGFGLGLGLGPGLH